MSLLDQLTRLPSTRATRPRLTASPFEAADLDTIPGSDLSSSKVAGDPPASLPDRPQDIIPTADAEHLRFCRRHGMKAHEMEAIACLEQHMAEGGAVHLENAIAFIEQLRHDEYSQF